MNNTGCNAYKQTATNIVENKSNVLFMLFDGMQKFISLARMGLAENNVKIRGENISKIMAIVTELDSALSKDIGGDMADNLSSLYQYVMERLTVANIKNDVAALDDADKILKEIKEGFESIADHEPSSREVNGPHLKETADQGGLRVAV